MTTFLGHVLVLALSQTEAPLPGRLRAVWEPCKAYHEKTPTRRRICLGGLGCG